VAPQGRLVACCNLATLPPHRFDTMVAEGVARAGRRGGVGPAMGPSPVDFPATAEHPAALKVRVFELA
jgi:23S rRNA (cytosine1962-C5)-methyltransferase